MLRESDQLLMIRDILWVAFHATHRSLVPFLVAVHALPVMGAFETDSPGQHRIESPLVAGGTPGGFKRFWVGRPVMMTDEAVLEKPGVFLMHKPHRAVKVIFRLYNRVVQEEIAVLNVL